MVIRGNKYTDYGIRRDFTAKPLAFGYKESGFPSQLCLLFKFPNLFYQFITGRYDLLQ